MKVELDVVDCDRVVIEVLRDSVKNCKNGSTHPEDKIYARMHELAVTIVLEHFGATIEQ